MFVDKVLTNLIRLFVPEDLQLMIEHVQAQNANYVAAKQVTRHATHPRAHATGCAGSDNLIDWLTFMGAMLGVTLVVQVFSADNDAKCRFFLQNATPRGAEPA